jgi:hypothetical protein
LSGEKEISDFSLKDPDFLLLRDFGFLVAEAASTKTEAGGTWFAPGAT